MNKPTNTENTKQRKTSKFRLIRSIQHCFSFTPRLDSMNRNIRGRLHSRMVNISHIAKESDLMSGCAIYSLIFKTRDSSFDFCIYTVEISTRFSWTKNNSDDPWSICVQINALFSFLVCPSQWVWPTTWSMLMESRWITKPWTEVLCRTKLQWLWEPNRGPRQHVPGFKIQHIRLIQFSGQIFQNYEKYLKIL